MKKNLRNIFALVAILSVSSACEGIPDYQKTIDSVPGVIYIGSDCGDTFETLVSHRPVGSTAEFHANFLLKNNAGNHGAMTVVFEYDSDLVASYNEKHGTQCLALPEECIVVENQMVTIPANATAATDTVKLAIADGADLSALTGPEYLAPYKVVSQDLATSEEFGYVWVIFNTEVNMVRPISSLKEIIGHTVGTAGWTADCEDYSKIFDGSSYTYVSYAAGPAVLTIDMQEVRNVTGLHFNASGVNKVSIEYSADGIEWKQAGTPLAGEYVVNKADNDIAFYNYLKGQYLRLTFDGANMRIFEVSAYTLENTEPEIFAVAEEGSLIKGSIVHKKSSSLIELDAEFKVFSTVSSDKGYNVTAAIDNSLVAGYNAIHGTSYQELPSEYADLQNTSLTIAPNDNAASETVVFGLKGEVRNLNSSEGYLVPVRLSSPDAKISENEGVVYIAISTESSIIKILETSADLIGFSADDRSTWTVSGVTYGGQNLFDGKLNTSPGLKNGSNVLEFDLGGMHMFTGLYIYGGEPANLAIEYSTDGNNWISAGTVKENERLFEVVSGVNGHYYVGLENYVEASHLRLTFEKKSGNMFEFSIYEVDSKEPAVFASCGDRNRFTGKIVHHSVYGSLASLYASFDVRATEANADGFSVKAEVDNSLVDDFNSKYGTSYASLAPSYIGISGSPCKIAAGALVSESNVSVALKGNFSTLTNAEGYVVPIRLTASGLVTSQGKGVVYIIVNVSESSAEIQDNFDYRSISGNIVEDRTAWEIIDCNRDDLNMNYSKEYSSLLDGDLNTFVYPNSGKPVSFTVDLGKEYDMTGLRISGREYFGNVSNPQSIEIQTSLDNSAYQEVGTATQSDATMAIEKPSVYVSFYAPKKARYVKILANYGYSNNGTAEFDIYAK